MKTSFGSLLFRLLRGGVRLSDAECVVLSTLVERLPAGLRAIVEMQFDRYNLAQREVDGRALNFHSLGPASGELPLIPLNAEECPLLRRRLELEPGAKTVHAVLWAVGGRAFCVSLSERIDCLSVESMRVAQMTESWRANVNLEKVQPAPCRDPPGAAGGGRRTRGG